MKLLSETTRRRLLTDRSISEYGEGMARPKAFDTEQALDAAISVFREHGFEGSSADMLVRAMGIGRQSLYDTFGDKWQLYRMAVQSYGNAERAAHLDALRSGTRAIDGIGAMIARAVDNADQPCLGVGSLCEFGQSRPELAVVHASLGKALRAAIAARLRDAQQEGDIRADLDPDAGADYLIANIAGIRIAARGGADRASLRGLGDMALRAFR